MAWKFKRPESDNWWIGYRLNGKQYRRSTDSPDEAVADREMARLEAMNQAHKAGSLTEEFFRLLTNRTAGVNTLRGTVKQWLGECKDYSPRTLESYQDKLEEFCQHIGASDAFALRDVRPDTIRDYLRTKRAATSAATSKQYRKVLNAFFNYAKDNEIISTNPVPSSKSLKLTVRKGQADKDKRRSFTLKELKDVYGKAPDDFWRYMVVGGFYTALRMGDLIMMPWGAVDFERGQINLTTRKTGEVMHIPIHPEFRTLLLKRKKGAGQVKPTDYIWPDKAERYERLGAAVFSNEFYDDVLLPAGLVVKRSKHPEKDKDGKPIFKQGRKTNPISFHCLRHTFVSLVKISGASQAVAKELAGHSSDAVSDLYTHVPEEALSKAINKLPEVTK